MKGWIGFVGLFIWPRQSNWPARICFECGAKVWRRRLSARRLQGVICRACHRLEVEHLREFLAEELEANHLGGIG
jgi:hypothetical protein